MIIYDENDIHDNILSTLPEVEKFNSMEQLEEVNASLGWKVQYRQLSKGNFKYRAMAKGSSNGISLMREALNLKVEVVGEYQSEYMAVLIPTKGDTVWSNGYTLNEN